MNEVLDFLKECGVYFISTVDGDQPRVRPFGSYVEYDGRICYCTSNQKPIYAQLKANPNVEISASTKDARWIRLSGKAVFCTTRDAKARVLEEMPTLRSLYSEDDDKLEVFYLDDAVATICAFGGENRTIRL